MRSTFLGVESIIQVLRILYLKPPGIGWQSVTYFATLAAELLGADLRVVAWDRPNQLHRKLGAMIPKRKRKGKLLVIAPQPEHLLGVVSFREWLMGSEHTAALVTDSSWVDRVPRMVRKTNFYDQLFIHDRELLGEWESRSGRTVSWVPVGSDVFRWGSNSPVRQVDLLRIGRQPPAWENDDLVGELATRIGVIARGRPPKFANAAVGYPALMRATANSKFTLAFSNKINPTSYTPKNEFLSYRWVDAIACGTVVAGIPPACDSARELLWPEALLTVSAEDLEFGLRQVKQAVERWSPSLSVSLYQKALSKLDWRWRLESIAAHMGIYSPALEGEIRQIETQIRM